MYGYLLERVTDMNLFLYIQILDNSFYELIFRYGNFEINGSWWYQFMRK